MEKKKILIIDDQNLFGDMLRMFLDKMGEYEIQIETEPTKSVDVVKTFKPDLILLDIIMPKINGMAIMVELKKDPETAQIPVIMLTSLDVGARKINQINKLCAGYVKKSSDLKVLKKKIDDALVKAKN